MVNSVDDQGTGVDDNFSVVASRVETLLQEGDEEDRQTEHALATTMELLRETHSLVSFPRATVATTVERGIHVYWRVRFATRMPA